MSLIRTYIEKCKKWVMKIVRHKDFKVYFILWLMITIPYLIGLFLGDPVVSYCERHQYTFPNNLWRVWWEYAVITWYYVYLTKFFGWKRYSITPMERWSSLNVLFGVPFLLVNYFWSC